MKHFHLPVLLLAVPILGWQLLATDALAQWSTDPNVNNPICTTVNQQQAPRVVSDGNGGAIITWWDLNLTTSDYNIYAQRITANGEVQWTVDGIAICSNPALQHVPEMISDGNGGAIIVWQDNRSGNADIYAQRINGNGVVRWTGDGVPVCDTTGDQTFPQLVSDGNGGAIVTWQDLRGGTNYVPYAQKLDSNGVAQWTPKGVLLSSTGTTETPQITTDGNGGAIIAWHQYISPPGQFDIYAQQINTNGVLGWGSNGVVLCALTSNQFRPQLISNDSGGTIVVWEDYRNGSYSNLYAQKVNSDGVTQWTLNGVAIAPNTLHQIRHRLLRDGSGGAFITWQYASGGLINTIYAQRISSNGGQEWVSDGVSIGSAGDSRYPDIATDGRTGSIITWYDFRGSGNGDIFAQRIDSAGTVQWAANGASVCRDASGQEFPRIAADGNGGAILTWEDARNSVSASTDIYAQRISSNGTLESVTGVYENRHSMPTTFTLEQNYPNPFNPVTTISFGIPRSSHIRLSIMNVLGQELATPVDEDRDAGFYTVSWDAFKFPSGVYFYRLQAGSFVETKKLILLR
jgi:hypothetical protein